jgi:hypothetical protein
VLLEVALPLASVAFTVKVKVPEFDGVPDIKPLEDIDNPAGIDPVFKE